MKLLEDSNRDSLEDSNRDSLEDSKVLGKNGLDCHGPDFPNCQEVTFLGIL